MYIQKIVPQTDNPFDDRDENDERDYDIQEALTEARSKGIILIYTNHTMTEDPFQGLRDSGGLIVNHPFVMFAHCTEDEMLTTAAKVSIELDSAVSLAADTLRDAFETRGFMVKEDPMKSILHISLDRTPAAIAEFQQYMLKLQEWWDD